MATSVLVVEDESVIAEDIRCTLESLGYEVPTTAASGAAAISAVEQARPGLVLMDVRLKGAMDGIEAAGVLRDRFNVPVVFLTSHSDEATLSRAKQTQPYGYLLKPFNDRELRTAIEVALHKFELETKLAEREHWFSTTLESIGDAVIATDQGERITFMNRVAAALTGWTPEDAIGKKLSDVWQLVDESGQPLESPVARAIKGGFAVGIPTGTSLIGKSGGSLSVDDSASPIIDGHGKLLGGVVVFRDVTERQRIEKRLAQSERLASIGTMAAGTAHEINNPLAAVIANVSFVLDEMSRLEEQVPAGAFEDLRGALDDACQAAERVRRIVHDLRKFTRVETASDLSLVDLPDVIEAALKLTDNELRHHATVRRAYGTTPFVMGNEGQLTQVLTNLLVNAAQSIAPGRAEKQQIRAATFTDEGGRAVIEVTDTGSGIAKANLARIFDPFFTTKPIGAGMGLGLAISRSIILSMGGDITVESVVGKGTTFRIALPPARQVPPPVDVPLESNLEIVRRGAVLVIDDEAAVARSIARVLSRHHEVAVESDARAAIHRIAGGELFDVIFCDLMMPNMTGIDFYGALESANPELAKRVVFMTGGAFSASSERFLESVANPVLPKPFGADSIRAIVGDYVK